MPETFETLILIILFSIPGAIFIYSYSRSFQPAERTTYIQEQFPLEVSILYVVSSVLIHSILFIFFVTTLNLIAWGLKEPNILHLLYTKFARFQLADLRTLTLMATIVMTHFFLSVALAHLLGKYWAKWNYLAVPTWCQQIVQIKATAQKNKENPIIELLFNNGKKLEGEWHNIRIINRKEISFEISIVQAKKNLIVWTSSDNVSSMRIKTSSRSLLFYFSQEKANNENTSTDQS